jgi:hypothetical protein
VTIIGHSKAILDTVLEATQWRLLQGERDALAVRQETHATRLESLAHTYLGNPDSPKHYSRAGQYPQLDSCVDEGCHFQVSNNIDYADDFAILLAWEELAGI